MPRPVLGDGNTGMITLSSPRAHSQQHVYFNRHHSPIHSFTHSVLEQTVWGSMIRHCAGHWMWCVLELTPMVPWGSRVGRGAASRGGEGGGHWIEPWACGLWRWGKGQQEKLSWGRGAMIAYSKLYWIHDLWGREFHFGTRQVASVTQSFVWQKFYYNQKGQRKHLT